MRHNVDSVIHQNLLTADAGSDLMNDALLNLCFGINSLDCLWKSIQTINTCNQDILNAPGF